MTASAVTARTVEEQRLRDVIQGAEEERRQIRRAAGPDHDDRRVVERDLLGDPDRLVGAARGGR